MRAMATALLAVALFSGQSQQPARPTFAVEVDAVRLDVLATDGRKPISGLEAPDFELRDNGVVQEVRSVAPEDVAIDVTLVLDSSQSVSGEPLRALRQAANTLLGRLRQKDRAALLAFSHRVERIVRLSADKRMVGDRVDAIVPSGATSLFDAVYVALVLCGDSPNRAMVLVFSDGVDTASWMRPSAVLEFAKQTEVVVYATMVAPLRRAPAGPPLLLSGPQAMITRPLATSTPPTESDHVPAFLEDLAGITGGRLSRADNHRDVRDTFVRALRDMKARYVLSYVPQGVERQGWHTIDVRLTRRKGKVMARQGYFVP